MRKRRVRYNKATNQYRSKYEQAVADSLTNYGIKFSYESQKIGYLKVRRGGECQECGSTNVGTHSIYIPDFVLSNGIYIEAKGLFVSQDRTKILSVLEGNNVLTRENFRMLFMRDKWTTPSKKESYLDWCDKHKIICAIGPDVPEEWVL